MGEIDNRDYLTGLYNRKGISEKFEEAASSGSVHLMFCDLDNFKSVNDIYGHAAGDELLIAFARLLEQKAPTAVPGRLGGDEFILTFSGEMSKDELATIATSIIDCLRECRKELQFATVVSVSIGIVWNQSSGSDLNQVLNKSDSTMYQAKLRGKGCYQFYDELEADLQVERDMENEITEALEADRFGLRFLPVGNIQSSYLEQSLLHVVWNRANGGIWSQEEYLPVLEKSGVICRLDFHVLSKLCEQLGLIKSQGKPHGQICVRLSRLTYLEDDLGDRLLEAMTKHNITQEDIILGISENAFGHRGSDEVLAGMVRLNAMGFHLELLSFGENFSSFVYLRQLPVDAICFAPSYLKENMRTARGRQIIKTLIRLGKDLKQLMIADGVSARDEVQFLMGCGCDAASGSFYSDILDEEDFLGYVKERIRKDDTVHVYRFDGNLKSEVGLYEGKFIGKGVKYIKGISDKWGGLHFPGGGIGENVVTFPPELCASRSFTIAMWIKPESMWDWSSTFYAQYIAGFVSVVPYAANGTACFFRICEEEDLNGWHDVSTHSFDVGVWTHIVTTYDAISGTMRLYFNSKKAGYKENVPIMYSCSTAMLGGDAFQRAYNGDISSFMIVDRALTEQEVEDLYDSYLVEPGFCGQLDIRTQLEIKREKMINLDNSNQE